MNANYEDVFELNFPRVDTNKVIEVIESNENWSQYNHRKPNNRQGLSVTSLDGGMSGVPDLDSLLEYGNETGSFHSEREFNVRTPIVSELPEVELLLDYFENDVGRSHFIRMPSGGFFPPHRDNGYSLPAESFRVVLPLQDVTATGPFVWLLDGKPIQLNKGKTYFVNTSKNHSLFSMCDTFHLFVMNILCSERSLKKLLRAATVR